jgi:hypothetical protein
LAQVRAQTATPDDSLLPDLPHNPTSALAEARMAEAQPLAHEMQAELAKRVADHMRHCKATLQEALAAVDRPLTPDEQERILQKYPLGVGWADLERLADRDPVLALQKWEEIKEAARDDLKSGLRAAEALGGSPQERARFLAIRQALASQWQPRGGLEWQLIDTLAQAQASWLTWLQAVTLFAASDSLFDAGMGNRGRPKETTPRLSTAEAIDRAAALAERFNRIALRTLRALCSLRLCSPRVIVRAAGQVNVGRQQVNVAAPCVAESGQRPA